MLCDVVVRRRRWAHAPVIHAASHFYHEKRDAWVSISVHACDPVLIVLGLRLAALRAAGAPLIIYLFRRKKTNLVMTLLNGGSYKFTHNYVLCKSSKSISFVFTH